MRCWLEIGIGTRIYGYNVISHNSVASISMRSDMIGNGFNVISGIYQNVIDGY